MSPAATPAKNRRRIQPANLADLPSVLDVEQTSNVLRCSVERVRALTRDGSLRRLAYLQTAWIYDAEEVRRFLRVQSVPGGALDEERPR